MKLSFQDPPTVGDIRIFKDDPPKRSKSGALLTVRMMAGIPEASGFSVYDREELKSALAVEAGLRVYLVRHIPQGGMGGGEFHRLRQEIIFGLEGQIKWVFEDLFGKQREFVLTPNNGFWLPPFILHTYAALLNGSGLLAMANTRFDPANPATHDTYQLGKFRELQQEVARRQSGK